MSSHSNFCNKDSNKSLRVMTFNGTKWYVGEVRSGTETLDLLQGGRENLPCITADHFTGTPEYYKLIRRMRTHFSKLKST